MTRACVVLVCFLNCVIISAFADADKSNIDTLQFVHLIWRHGDRSATGTFPTDVNNSESSWPQGWGELTPFGIKQQYELGSYLRHRYAGYLSQYYSKYEVYVRSTNYNRTIMSAMANMAGLFPPSQKQTWHEEIAWQPIPIHSWPAEYDKILLGNYDCPRRSTLWQERVSNLDAYRKLVQDNLSFIEFLRNKTGLPLKDGVSGSVYDPLFCEHDSTLVPLMQSLGVFNARLPPYAACFAIELHRPTEGSDFIVKLWYRNGTTRYLTMPDCPPPCTMTQFVARSQPYIPVDVHTECLNWWDLSSRSYATTATLLCVFLAISLSLMTSLLWRLRRRNDVYAGRQLLPQESESDDDEMNYLS